jgi:hypothetical protein
VQSNFFRVSRDADRYNVRISGSENPHSWQEVRLMKDTPCTLKDYLRFGWPAFWKRDIFWGSFAANFSTNVKTVVSFACSGKVKQSQPDISNWTSTARLCCESNSGTSNA